MEFFFSNCVSQSITSIEFWENHRTYLKPEPQQSNDNIILVKLQWKVKQIVKNATIQLLDVQKQLNRLFY